MLYNIKLTRVTVKVTLVSFGNIFLPVQIKIVDKACTGFIPWHLKVNRGKLSQVNYQDKYIYFLPSSHTIVTSSPPVPFAI